jgi:predicted ATP-grasp superfamily ATP-dependent carboligase
VQDPTSLYRLDTDVQAAAGLRAPVLVHVLNGFLDAGGGGRIAADHLLTSLPTEVLAEFDVDQLVDYRARRPAMTFVENRYEAYERPRLALHAVRDASGAPFLLLHGPEPDFQWERFCQAVIGLVEQLQVGTVIGLSAFPFPAPHTRPMALTAHATDPSLIEGRTSWVGALQVPGSAAALLQLRLGEAGHPAMGFAAHVPHYVAQFEYPAAAATLLEAFAGAANLVIPTGELHVAADRTRSEVDEQLAANPENAEVVRGLEQQYDAFLRGASGGLPIADAAELPSADEIAAEFERFLAQQDPGDERG